MEIIKSPLLHKQEADSAGICELPQELFFDILLRLPVKSLLKFRCVSKSWYYLISSKQFVQSQLNYAKNNTDYLRVVSDKRVDGRFEFVLFKLNALLNRLDDNQVTTSDFHYPISDKVCSLQFLGSINGLCCAFIQEMERPRKLFVWNPSTGISRELPHIDGIINWEVYNIGFGFDGDDYKVLAVFAFDLCKGVKIYSSRFNSWKIVDKLMPIATDLYDKFGKFANGKLYWRRNRPLFRDGLKYGMNELFYFDLESEAYGTIEPPPTSMDVGHALWWEVLEQHICLITYLTFSMDVWVLKHHGLKYGSWHKRTSIPHDFCNRVKFIHKPVWITREGEIIWQRHQPRQYDIREHVFKFYNPESNSIRQSNVTVDYKLLFESKVYITSLVSPVPDDCDTKQGDMGLIGSLVARLSLN